MPGRKGGARNGGRTATRILLVSVITALASMFILSGLLPGRTFSPVGLLNDYVPWNSLGPVPAPQARVQADLIFQMHPWLSWSAGRVREGILP